MLLQIPLSHASQFWLLHLLTQALFWQSRHLLDSHVVLQIPAPLHVSQPVHKD